jgi:hypothetical protein
MGIQEDPMFQQRWIMYREALRVGLPIVSLETCAIICAGLLVHGNNENFTHNHRLVCELQYAQERFNIKGGGTVTDQKFKTALNYYIDLMELNYKRDNIVPDFINDMFKDRYGFYLLPKG